MSIICKIIKKQSSFLLTVVNEIINKLDLITLIKIV
jgi:hypothetical protein